MMENTETKNQGFDIKQFIEDSKATLLNPKEYFEKLPLSGGFTEPVIKVLIYGVVIGILRLIWSVIGIGIASGPAWLGGGIGFMAFMGSIIGAMIGLFLGGAIMMLISAIFKGNTDYEANVRVVASLMVINVISAVFGFFDSINLYLGALIGIAISLYGLYLTYIALTRLLKAEENGVKILLIVLAVLVSIFSFTGIATKRAIQSFTGTYNYEEFQNMTTEEQQKAALKMVEKFSNGEVKAEDMEKAIEEHKEYMEDMENEQNNDTDSVSE